MGRKRSELKSFNKLYYRYKVDAKKKGVCFELDKEQFGVITSSRCAYCHSEPSKSSNINIKESKDYIYNGIDRILSSDGYRIKNVLPCCEKCNYMKRTMNPTEFYNHILKIYNAQKEYFECLIESNVESV